MTSFSILFFSLVISPNKYVSILFKTEIHVSIIDECAQHIYNFKLYRN